LPQGNQLELAAATQQAELGPQDTERLVSLWQKAPLQVRPELLLSPRAALDRAFPKPTPPPVDARLTPKGQKLGQTLQRMIETISRTMTLLQPAPCPQDLAILAKEVRHVYAWTTELSSALGPYAKSERGAEPSERPATP
jgi:hypothetical protein